MDYKMLINVIQNRIDICVYLNFHEKEIISYINSSKFKDSVPIYSNENFIKLNRDNLINILKLYLNKKILEWDLEYILSNLELIYNGVDEKVDEVLYSFSNPYLNYFISSKNITEAIKYLKNKKEIMELNFTDFRLKQKGIEIRPNYNSKVLDSPTTM
ncbi:MAG: hypothetical protein CO068_00900 [Flavobacteriaceae bacterium CG_4_9_14_0_8_um_filter_34_30]|nr:hypothetical protein [Flavobacteriia bacterium]PJC08454.1 MAG: hypothetical protein CO068_00900 [Flavobacteriaceae bacterium CG_4_9_14_0_8_um_filter_34_30]